LTGTDESGTNLSHMSSTYVSSIRAMSCMKLITSTIMLENSFIVWHSFEFSRVYRTGWPGFGGSLRGFSLIHEILLGP